MDYRKEIARRDKRIETYKNSIKELREEITALRQLLDCAAANIVLLAKEQGGTLTLSRSEISQALGKYQLSAIRDKDGNYVLNVREELRISS